MTRPPSGGQLPDGGRTGVRLVFPHQLFLRHLEAPPDTRFVLVEDDLFFRHYAFHAHKLVLHRASMRRFAARLRAAGFAVDVVETDARASSGARLTTLLHELAPERVTVYDLVDDWLEQRTRRLLDDVGCPLDEEDVLESPGFLTTRAQVAQWSRTGSARMQHFYTWQRRRLGILLDGDGPLGGRWSFDTDNRRKLPRGHPVPPVAPPPRHTEVEAALAWVGEEFPDAPGRAHTFCWPTSHEEAAEAYETFLAERFAEFGPYEDALSTEHPYLFHSLLTPGLNIGLVDPAYVVRRALEVGEETGVGLASVEGFVRQVIGWREYMRATYVLWGRQMRTANHLRHTRSLDPGWWTAQTGLDPVDLVLERVLEHGYAHHIERLMVLGNAMCLLRTDPVEVYAWFMEMFVDAYDWVMVPNVHAMSQFAAGAAITTKPYVSGSNYLRKMSDLPKGDWAADWDGLYWAFVDDHREVFEANPRSRMMTRMWDGFDDATRAAHRERAAPWLR
ncbi:cryptochrome/photolyase family protein [Ornithinimicrobium sediminis]|uniref:cryptochrome/photolyase family protein n=1 Tax=Ornithinimicrobium sediminis TaxID=2904603 RepID=UPI001E56EF4E|nr:cryptochrome/photolyase family protein [Ornithinimicrobium sediminis]MCE0487189.1 cryptochrome/photolyase family protein [Ornithinimicrobium sediminis]